ncbi:zinc finger CCCH domain-containing protein 62 [Euphorbia lathyris]|uniref:zinc finger CCCH domain-containing protein 62 n=1 Tax=Euphorbia lathyris TaxID=212925 RepID=UPI003313C399
MTDRKRKRSVIYISSSSSSDDEEEEEEESEVEEIDDDEDEVDESEEEEIDDDEDEEDESELEENDDDGDEEISGDATDCSVDEGKESVNSDDDEAFCKHIIRLLREGKNLEALSLKECKAYLRKHSLRLAGSKDVCIHRIKEHWRIKEGNGESLYPRSSFVINCTGDVCTGDVVLFRQKVYEKFSKVTRNGNVLGMRTVAGRVVKESYGSTKQQHTFTVEVLWSKGTKQLSPLFPLLVKGRNLYKLKTFRQRWKNEAERVQVLSEKHRRGTAARAVRAMKISKKKQSANRHLNEGRKQQKCSRHKRPSQAKKTAELLKGKNACGHKKNTSLKHRKVSNHHQEVSSSRQLHLKGNARSDVGQNPIWRHSKSGHMNMEMDPSLHSHAYTRQDTFPWQMEFHNQNLPSQFPRHDFGGSSTMVSPHLLRPYAPDTSLMPPLQHQGFYHRNDFHHDQSNPSYNIGRSRSHHFPESIEAERHQFPRVQRPRGFQHSHPRRGRFGS